MYREKSETTNGDVDTAQATRHVTIVNDSREWKEEKFVKKNGKITT